jgi:acetylornithine deacetylase/succinyl-diaminopimelate desuccinylase-like protein
MKYFLALAATMITLSATAAPPQDTPAGEQRFRELYKELVETNTAFSAGGCTLAAERMAARLKAAGFLESDLHLFAAPDHEKEGGLVAVYPGRDPKLKAILLLAHIDVVEAKREDWTRDPFTLVEENGSFYARGAMDDKAEASIWVDLLIRYRLENYRPRRTLKIALTCGEEGGGSFDGAEWLTKNRRELIDAAFALNEGAWGEFDASGLSPGGGAHSDQCVRIPGAVQRRESRVLHRYGKAQGGKRRNRSRDRNERVPAQSWR